MKKPKTKIPSQIGTAFLKRSAAARKSIKAGRGVRLEKLLFGTAITFERGKRSGQPCIRGTRIAVVDVLDYLASGMSHKAILKDFPDLTEEDIRACLGYAAALVRGKQSLVEYLAKMSSH